MKQLKKACIIISIILLLGISTTWLETTCKRKHKEHADKHIIRCTYSQTDLARAHNKTPDRCSEHTCFYCGCPKDEHSEN